MSLGDYLFSDFDLVVQIRKVENSAFTEIANFDPKYLLEADPNAIADELVRKYGFKVPVLKLDEKYIAQQSEADVDVSQERGRDIRDRSNPYYVKGLRVLFAVPFEGPSGMFLCRPSTYEDNPPKGSCDDNAIYFSITQVEHDAEAMRKLFDTRIQTIQRWLGRIAQDVAPYNEGLRGRIEQAIKQRRDKLRKDRETVSALGFPIKQRPDAPTTYTVPVTRRELPVKTGPALSKPLKLEPRLEMRHYEQILNTISEMSRVFELSPEAFAKMEEENLRFLLLVPLNAQYEGQARGEVFNFKGKTDILIQVEGRNIFIAECLIWNGREYLRQKINQLLGYSSWRDTKTALIVFNRNKKLSAVLAQIPQVVREHSNYIRQDSDYNHETALRFMLRHPSDSERELLLTVLVFEVPIKP